MNQFWKGLLTFALVSVAGFLSFYFQPNFGGGPPYRIAERQATKQLNSIQEQENERAAAARLAEARRLAHRIESHGTLADLSAAEKKNDLVNSLVGNDLGKAIQTSEIECRERLRQLGVIITAGPCTDVSDIVDHLAKGTYSFNNPETAYVGERFTLRLVLKTAELQDVRPSLTGLEGKITEKPGQFAQSVEATLLGEDFEIKPAGAQLRTATLTKPVEWEWSLKPTSGGTKTVKWRRTFRLAPTSIAYKSTPFTKSS